MSALSRGDGRLLRQHAAHQVVIAGRQQVGRPGDAIGPDELAARREAAGGGRLGQVGRRARDRLEALAAHAVMHRRGEQATTVGMLRVDDVTNGIPVDALLIPHDGHPNAYTNKLIAAELKKRLLK